MRGHAAGPPAGTGHPTPGRRGFTIPEMVVVLAIFSVLVVLVLPRLEFMRYRLDGSTRGIVAALVTAQRTAVKRQHSVVVAVDTVNRWVRVHEDRDNDGVVETGERVRQVVLDDGVRFGVGGAPYRSAATSATVTFTARQDGLPAVSFHRSGSASEEGSFYLTSERAVRDSSYTKDARSIQVARATGRASWYYFDPPDWKQGF